MNNCSNGKKIRLNEIGKVITRRTPPTADIENFGKEYLFITPSDMDGRKRINDTERKVSSKGAAVISSCKIPSKSVCVSCIGWQMGKVAMTTKTSFTNQQINTIIPNENIVPDFLHYSLSTRREELKTLGSVGTRTPILKKSAFEKLEVYLPPYQNQIKITSILSNYDDLIENNTRRIEILEEMAKLVYEEWFIKFRFPGYENVKMVPTDLGNIPEGWEVKAFSEVIDVNPKRSLSKGKTVTKVSMADLSTWQSWINSWQKEEYKSGPKFKNGDTLFARITPCLENGKTAFVNFLREEETAFGSTEFIVFGPKVIESGSYIFCLSRSEYIRESAITAMTGTSGRQRVPSDFFDHLLICVPPKTIIRGFNEIVMPLFNLIKNNSKKSVCLKKTRDLLLPKLISGEIDVSDLNIRIRNEIQES
jgi:type I restriction enzyme, S subunit